jgi:Type I phosphodiesterase / nucleotide pyrophosphatase
MRLRGILTVAAVGAAGAVCSTYLEAAGPQAGPAMPPLQHVLLISVDGMHEVDLHRWVATHPHGALASLAHRGTIYSEAQTSKPSDSFPGMIAQATGGTPYSTGVFYDNTYDRTFYAPGSSCTGAPGAQVRYTEDLDRNLKGLAAGGTLGNPVSQIDPAKLPKELADGHCAAVWPHQYLRVNTIFEVLRQHGLHTAWSDKHPAYEILDGPSGHGIEDLFTPEVDAQMPGTPPGTDYTKSYTGVRDYDSLKVKAVVNEIGGRSSLGEPVGYVPAIFGMDLQAVSIGQKLAHGGYGDAPGLVGGYLDAAGTPGNALTLQLQFVDDALATLIRALEDAHLYDKTAIIVSAKHGQSPLDRTRRRAIPDTFAKVLAKDGYAFNVADDISLIWLAPARRTAETLRATVRDLDAAKASLGIHAILGRGELKKTYRDPATDSRTPDFLVVSDEGVVYTHGSALAEHGGVADADRHVALLVSAPGLAGQTISGRVSTTQIAPTILRMLKVPPGELQAVQIEGTRPLPGLFGPSH